MFLQSHYELTLIESESDITYNNNGFAIIGNWSIPILIFQLTINLKEYFLMPVTVIVRLISEIIFPWNHYPRFPFDFVYDNFQYLLCRLLDFLCAVHLIAQNRLV